jgi:hypothetical protein
MIESDTSVQGASFLENAFIKNFLIGAGFLLVIGWGILIAFIRPRETPLILHYNVYFGVDLIGIWWQAYILQGIATLLLIVHVVLARAFYMRKDRFAAYILLLAANFVLFGVVIVNANY